ncbi:MAG: nicotinate-nucleotide adenylyltransferase [Gammaproteobacteria bacterium]|nr:nicotinate-nucleotide adenylyltransferase [Gammaproteobacteria bacterium]
MIGVLGGTFDPIHYGHLRTGLELLQRLGLDEVRFIPCGTPPHRAEPGTPGPLRLRMVRAAVAGQRGFVADGRELERHGPCYTVDTLRSLREEFPSGTLCLLLGMDAFLYLPTWDRWEQLFELAHIVVAHRPGWEAPQTGPLGRLIAARRTAAAADLKSSRAGRVHVEAVTQLEISATELRAGIRAGGDPRYLVPDAVRDIIFETECYAEYDREERKG